MIGGQMASRFAALKISSSLPALQFWEDAPLIRRPLWVWVDALLASADWGGGNKAQVIAEQLPDLMRQGYNAVLSTGSEASNHVQALAQACSGSGMRCDLTLYPVPGGWYDPIPRLQRLAEAGATVHRIEHAAGLAQAMSARMDALVQLGYKTYYWHSDGDPAYALPAYMKASQRFLGAWERYGPHASAREGSEGPDQVFLATGTGLTLTGLRLGLPEATVLNGISIARDAQRIKSDAAIYLERYVSANKAKGTDTGSSHRPLGRMQVDDAHRMGGFGRTEPDLMRLSRDLTERSGVEFDPIYTAKAYAGMCATLNRQELPGHETIVFWHTGPQTNTANPIPPNPIPPNPIPPNPIPPNPV